MELPDPSDSPLIWRATTILISYGVVAPQLYPDRIELFWAAVAVLYAHLIGYQIGEAAELQRRIDDHTQIIENIRYYREKDE